MLAANGSIFTILAISFERYYAICKPLKAGYKCTRFRATIIICLIWLLSVILTSPILLMAKSVETIYIDGSLVYNCILEANTYWTKMYVFITMFAFFCLPLLVLMLVYWLIGRKLIRENVAMTGACQNNTNNTNTNTTTNNNNNNNNSSTSSNTTPTTTSSSCCCEIDSRQHQLTNHATNLKVTLSLMNRRRKEKNKLKKASSLKSFISPNHNNHHHHHHHHHHSTMVKQNNNTNLHQLDKSNKFKANKTLSLDGHNHYHHRQCSYRQLPTSAVAAAAAAATAASAKTTTTTTIQLSEPISEQEKSLPFLFMIGKFLSNLFKFDTANGPLNKSSEKANKYFTSSTNNLTPINGKNVVLLAGKQVPEVSDTSCDNSLKGVQFSSIKGGTEEESKIDELATGNSRKLIKNLSFSSQANSLSTNGTNLPVSENSSSASILDNQQTVNTMAKICLQDSSSNPSPKETPKPILSYSKSNLLGDSMKRMDPAAGCNATQQLVQCHNQRVSFSSSVSVGSKSSSPYLSSSSTCSSKSNSPDSLLNDIESSKKVVCIQTCDSSNKALLEEENSSLIHTDELHTGCGGGGGGGGGSGGGGKCRTILNQNYISFKQRMQSKRSVSQQLNSCNLHSGELSSIVQDLSKKQQMDSRRQVVIMLAFVVTCFFLLFFPYRVFTIWLILSTEDQVQSLGMETYYNLTYFSRILIYLHSAINPIAYNLISTKFRKAFMSILLCRGSSSRRHFITEHRIIDTNKRQSLMKQRQSLSLPPSSSMSASTSSSAAATAQMTRKVSINNKY